MAKAKVRGIEEEINRVFRNYEKSLTKAMQYAADEAEWDIMREAESCLIQYYKNYKPRQYSRLDRFQGDEFTEIAGLRTAFLPYNEVKKDGDAIIAQAGVVYDSSRLDGLYWSRASQKPEFNPVSGDWVLENYLNGIHPTTDQFGAYIPISDHVSPKQTMEGFLEEYYNTFAKNVLNKFVFLVSRR